MPRLSICVDERVGVAHEVAVDGGVVGDHEAPERAVGVAGHAAGGEDDGAGAGVEDGAVGIFGIAAEQGEGDDVAAGVGAVEGADRLWGPGLVGGGFVLEHQGVGASLARLVGAAGDAVAGGEDVVEGRAFSPGGDGSVATGDGVVPAAEAEAGVDGVVGGGLVAGLGGVAPVEGGVLGRDVAGFEGGDVIDGAFARKTLQKGCDVVREGHVRRR
jgi:hypothetical protein